MMRSKTLCILLLLCGYCTAVSAQQNDSNPWTFVEEKAIAKKDDVRVIQPLKYQTFQANLTKLEAILEQAPQRFTTEANQKQIVIDIPLPNQTFESFVILNAPVMHPSLAARYPEIQTYAGYGLNDPSTQIRLDLTPHGFHAMIRSPRYNSVFIEPYSRFQRENYMVYYKKDNPRTAPFTCSFDEHNNVENIKQDDNVESDFRMAGDCSIRTYRLALACTGEYATFHGGTKPLALAAMNTSMNRVNGIYETDASITMVIIPNNDDIIFLNSGTDPYTNGSGGAMLGENQTTCDNVIGFANYDIGHVFSTGGGGVAYLQSPCGNLKAGGVTGQGAPTGDTFDVDYVAHEIGHQFGGNHTQNNTCQQSNASYEPGSASTIMGYAGICSPNVQNNSDAYFHGFNIQEIASFSNGSGNSCAVVTATANTAPVANAGNDYTIPGQTPFVLTGSATDAENLSAVTYCWEQFDNEDPDGTSVPLPTSTSGPAFRSFFATSSPSRYIPRLSDVIANNSPTWEVLATVDRDYTFNLAVRDNNPGNGCTGEDEMTVTVDGDAGPFLVTVPNTFLTWFASTTHTVTWDVAGTDVAPVNTANVDILLSTDGGNTYPFTLATAVANDGSHDVVMPNVTTTTARIMVRANGNIYYDISNTDFEIINGSPDFEMVANPTTLTICQGDDANFVVTLNNIAGFSGDVDLTATGLPSGSNSSFSPVTISNADASNFTITNTASAPAGIYMINISGNNASLGTKTVDVTLEIEATGLINPISLTSPANSATNESVTPSFSWSIDAAASGYDIEIATDAGFTSIVDTQTGLTNNTYTPSTALSASTTYYWRVRGTNNCEDGAYSTEWTFTTANIVCASTPASDTPFTISATAAVPVSSVVNIPTSATITDVIVSNIDITHTWVGDLIITLEHGGTTVTLMDQPGLPASQFGCDEDDILASFDDAASNLVENECANTTPTISGTYLPIDALSAFDGMDMMGDWTLTVDDQYLDADGGSFNGWSIDICAEVANPCVANMNIPDASIMPGTYQTSILISSTGGVTNGAVIFDAGNCVELNPDFEVVLGAEFDAFIGGCQ